MYNVRPNIKSKKDIYFVIYNIVLLKKNKEFTVEEIAKEIEPYIKEDSNAMKAFTMVKKLFRVWLKSGMLEERIDGFVRV